MLRKLFCANSRVMDCSSLRSACLVAWGCAAFSAAFPVHGASAAADDFPNKPIRIVVGFTPGSTPDLSTRLISQKLAESWKQPVVVDNRAGAAGIIAAQITAGANPDGYTLLSVSASHASGPATRAKLPYDTLTDFAGISRTLSAPSLLVVSPSLGVKSVKELIALAKAKPGQLNYSSSGVGGPMHLAAELFKIRSGMDLVHVPYKGGAPAAAAVLGGEVQMLFGSVAMTMPQVGAGKLKALATTGPKRSPVAPEVPTLDESGLSGFNVTSWTGLIVPAKTEDAIVKRLHQEALAALKLVDVQAAMARQGLQITTSKPAEFAAQIRAETKVWAEVIKAAGIRAEQY